MNRIKKFETYITESKSEQYVSLSKEEKEFLWNKMEVRKKARAKDKETLVFKQLRSDENLTSESQFIDILNSLEYSIKKRVKEGKTLKGKYEKAFTSLQDKLPNSWMGVKYSSLKAKEKRDSKPPSKSSTKKEIMDWLVKKEISFDKNETKEQLYNKIEK
jgi:hypothetical protein